MSHFTKVEIKIREKQYNVETEMTGTILVERERLEKIFNHIVSVYGELKKSNDKVNVEEIANQRASDEF